MDRALYVAGSYVGQGVVSAFNRELVPDGKWGRYTQRLYEALPPSKRFAVDAALRSVDTTAGELLRFREEERALGAVSTVDATDVKSLISKAAMEAGVDVRTAIGYAAIESDLGRNTGGPARRAKFPAGYHGLMQMGSMAWAAARAVDPSLPAFTAEAAYDNLTNARAAMAFAKSNIREARRLGYTGPIGATELYLMHQQGAGGFVWLWSKATGQPNKLPARFAVPDKHLVGNPPHDKRGPTTDPAAFIARWDDVVKKQVDLA